MRKQVLVVHISKNGHKYAWYIAKELRLLGFECELADVFTVDEVLERKDWGKDDTLVHFRTAGPIRATPKAKELEERGYRVVNSAKALERTSDKFLSYKWAERKGVKLPLTRKGSRDEIEKWVKTADMKKYVVKPINSVSQGAYCFRVKKGDEDLGEKLKKVPGKEIILQEFINYRKIYRVIVIGGQALREAVFYDEPTKGNWKVSVCLNPNLEWERKVDEELLDYGLMIAKVFETEVGFIDIYQTEKGYVLSEINTACLLMIHERKSGYNISKDIASYLISRF